MTADEYYVTKEVIEQCVKLGAIEVLRQLRPKSDELSMREACKRYGQSWIKEHIRRGTFKPTRKGVHDNSPLVLSLREIEATRTAELVFKAQIVSRKGREKGDQKAS